MVVYDEPHIRNLLKFLLNGEGYNVLAVGTGEVAISIGRRNDIQLVILHINLLGILVLFLSSRDDDYDVIFGLEVGAPDYLRKPFNHRELILRVANLVGRKPESISSKKVYSCKDLIMDTARSQISINEKNIRLTPIKIDLLVHLMSR